MNRLTKSSSRRGDGARGTRYLSVGGPMTSAPAARASATQRLPTGCSTAAAGVPDPPGSASPFGGCWTASSPSQGLYPPGGFSKFLQSNPFANHPNGNENFHFVGGGMSQSSVSPIDLGTTRTPSPAHDLDAEEDGTIDVDDDSRTDRRLNCSVPEDIRLANAWLHSWKDPVDGNGKKVDAYWGDVTEQYNKTIENSRKRNRNQVAIEDNLLPPRPVAARSTEESLLPPRPVAARSTEESLVPPRPIAARSTEESLLPLGLL